MTTSSSGYVNSDLLVETQWLAERLQRREFRIVDMGARDAYLRAHIPGALHPGPAEKSHYIKDPDDPQYVMPKEKFEALMSSLGIGNETIVIAYDADGGHTAARLWWVMSYYGRPNCKLLNGGWNKWMAERRPVSLELPAYPAAAFTAIERPALIAYVDDVEKAVAAKEPLLLDVRSDAEWEGTETRGNKRSGRIPGAVHIEWKNFVTNDALRVFKPASEIQQLLWKAGVTPNKKVTTY